jgi:DNA-binding NtrC family response regulator
MSATHHAESPREFEALIADDDAGVRELLVDFLGARGLSVASTPDGRAAVTALERSGGRCRLVFTDIAMPGADGFSVLAAARAANPFVYVVMITGYGSLETAISAVRAGAQDYLTKPFSLGQVEVILRQAATRFDLEEERRQRGQGSLTTTLASIDTRLASLEQQIHDISLRLGPMRKS